MKKTALLVLALCAVLMGCNREPEDGPSKKERKMVKEEMTWTLDSVLVVYDYQTDHEQSFMLRKDEGLITWSFTFYPYTYTFPAELTAFNGMSGDVISYAEQYSEPYCKYICSDDQGIFLSAGYMCYYNDMFCLRGMKSDGTLEMRVVDANTNWNEPVWTITFNPVVMEDNTIQEHRVEYYSRVK